MIFRRGTKKAILGAALCLMTSVLSAQNLEDLLPGLPAATRAELTEKRELVRYTEGAPAFSLLPAGPLAEELRREFQGFSPNITDEILFLMPLPEAREDGELFLYNKLRDVTGLSGIRYRSSSRDGSRVLFSDVYAVDSPKSRRRVPFVPVSAIPREERFPLHLEDANFGSGYYEAALFHQEGRTSFGLRNLTTLKYIFPVFREGRVRFRILLIPLEKELLMYGIVAAETGGLVRSMVDMPSALGKRVRALRDWFVGQVYGAGEPEGGKAAPPQ